MEASKKDYVVHNLDHEPMDVDRDMPSVSSIACMQFSCLYSSSTSADVYGLTNTQRTHAQYMYNKHGPTPRVCINFVLVPGQLFSYQPHLENRVPSFYIGLDGQYLVRALYDSSDLNLDDFGSIFLARREDVANLQDFKLEPITPFIRQLLRSNSWNCSEANK